MNQSGSPVRLHAIPPVFSASTPRYLQRDVVSRSRTFYSDDQKVGVESLFLKAGCATLTAGANIYARSITLGSLNVTETTGGCARGAPLLALFEKWHAEPPTRFDSGVGPPLPTSKHHTQKNTSFQATIKNFIFRRTDGETSFAATTLSNSSSNIGGGLDQL